MHIPVLSNEIISYLNIAPGKKYIDATYGMGGHSKMILGLGGQLLGIDRDQSLVFVEKIATSSTDGQLQNSGNLLVVHGNFAYLSEIAKSYGFETVDGILFDLGLGSHQLDDPHRGFSFQKDGPLDMRYDRGDDGESKILDHKTMTAESIVNFYPEKELLKIFREYGEEKRFGRKIARAIMIARKSGSIKTTYQLFGIIKSALPGKFRFKAGDTARRIFQALRIKVNAELSNLEKALPQALEILAIGGRLAVVSFQSLEDRIVKNFFKAKSLDCICPPEFPICRCDVRASLKILTRKPIAAKEEEIKTNSRAKSAKLRVAEKI